MPGSPARFTPPASRPPRRLILCAAVVLAVSVWSATQGPAASAEEPKAPAAPALPAAAAPPPEPGASAEPAKGAPAGERRPGFAITIDAKSDADAAQATAEGRDAAAAKTAANDAGPAPRTVTVKKGDKTVTVTGIPGDREYDSFGELVHAEPALGAMIVGIVAIVFFAPVLAIALIVGYRMRKARMQNETMLKLAERGIVATPEALAAVGGNPSALALAASGEAAKGIRVRAAWSDLRKGVLMTAIGLALSAHSLIDDQSSNPLGLVLLFLGIGYAVLWWFEQRQIGAPGAGAASGRAPGDAGNGA